MRARNEDWYYLNYDSKTLPGSVTGGGCRACQSVQDEINKSMQGITS